MDKTSLGFTKCDKYSSGEWDLVDFEEQGRFGFVNDPNCADGGSAGCQESWTRDGFPGPVYFTNPFAFTPNPADRIPSNPGLGSSGGIAGGSGFRDALSSLPGKTIQIPVTEWLVKDAPTFPEDRFGLVGVMTVKVCSTFAKRSEYRDPNFSTADCDKLVTSGCRPRVHQRVDVVAGRQGPLRNVGTTA